MIQEGRKEKTAQGSAIVALAGMNVIWGAMFPITKPALEIIPPFTFALLRFLLAMAIIMPLAWRKAWELLTGIDGAKLAFIGLLGFCVAQVAQTMALKLSTASDIALLSTTSPLWIALLARLWLHERLSPIGGLGFAISVAGLALILWPEEFGGPLGVGQRVLGDLLFMITGFTWACYNVMGKALLERYPPLPVTAAAGLVGTLGIVPFAGFELLKGHTVKFTFISVAGIDAVESRLRKL